MALLLPGLGIAAAGIVWSASMWIDWRLADRLQMAASAVLEGRTPSGDASFRSIAEGRVGLERFACAADMRRSLAIVELNRLEHASASEASQMAPGVAEDLRHSLRCTPTDGFAWFALGWLAERAGWRNGFAWNCFEKSYQTAPWEGWIALRRNPVLVSQLDRLPPALAARAVFEFRTIVSNGYYQEAFAILTGPGWVERERLVAALADADPIKRYNFAQMLSRADIELNVPGIAPKDSRPWNS